ncbi:phenylacetic acid degradation protein PaaN [Streptomyces lunaelactis]|uniref:Phenylacetic acid degradation protein PaaN n=1 Tax=Streptomyces lunaelactis TaxID=1535768 RepID=A0A2R4SX54_9ACTN|nr:phenylacetic acid degradation protein PaaN [Streptomyces lunaelactis]AVZ71448.1 phenylacetic acid degradation protein PaaN [Streptomyces lunaelactis]NUK02851.1 phenylacetic acid degradation protein PaaN [Streptomyces lunaelactis]NUK11616.1 phenylacetic acid degradation protein PaaN [Streptomyces lunaelactis]NUK19273.1 phenylacetic acid degradation protein PaaN [Streptomyces lunaelactis]NUK24825.1 phenylacetic acid degradation protein PaaN [Streptomyces lunaelactis]
MRTGSFEERSLLEQAVQAAVSGASFTPFTEGLAGSVDRRRGAAHSAGAVFRSMLGQDFCLGQPGARQGVGTESSPYGISLGVRYPRSEPGELVGAAVRAMAGWRAAGPRRRAELAVEVLCRLHDRSHEIAHALHHTTGQAYATAHRAGSLHAQDRGLEAVAHALAASTRTPADMYGERLAERGGPRQMDVPLGMDGTCTVVPRGVSLLIGCPDFPTWNGYPGLFASLVTGNPLIVKPHPRAVLPLALTVQVARDVLRKAGHDPNVVTLAAEKPGEQLAPRFATDPEVRVIDFTGSVRFGEWLHRNARQASVYATPIGANTVLMDSTDGYRRMLRELALSLSLCSGQSCTAPQNILVPSGGIRTDEGRKTIGRFSVDLSRAVKRLLAEPRRAAGILGAIGSDRIRTSLAHAAGCGVVVHASSPVAHPDHPAADIRTPLIVRLEAHDEQVYAREWAGPVSFVIATESTSHSLDIFRRTARRHGGQFATVHSTDPLVLGAVEIAALDAGVHLSENLAGSVFMDQSAVYGDFCAAEVSPGAHTALADPSFITGRFRLVQARRPAVRVHDISAAEA